MANIEQFVEAHMAEFDAKLATHLHEFDRQVDAIFEEADMVLCVLGGIRKYVITETEALSLPRLLKAGWGLEGDRNEDGSYVDAEVEETVNLVHGLIGG